MSHTPLINLLVILFLMLSQLFIIEIPRKKVKY